MNEKPKSFTAILFAIAGILAFMACYYLSQFLMKFLIDFLWDVPLVGSIVQMVFPAGSYSTELLMNILSPMLAYGGTLFFLALVNKHEPTYRLSCEITGVVIMSIHIVAAVFNVIAGATILTNLTQLIAGYLLFSNRKN